MLIVEVEALASKYTCNAKSKKNAMANFRIRYVFEL